MKEGWKQLKLSEICISIDDGDWIEKKDQSETGIRLVQTGNIGIGVFKDKAEKAKFISDETFERLNCLEIKAGDILISRLPEPVGRGCLLPDLPSRCITAVDCSILRANSDLVDAKWIVYYTMSNIYQKLVNKECGGATRARITRKKLSEIQIPVPSLSEQERIVKQLDEAFAKIDALKQNAEKGLQAVKDLWQATLKEELKPKEGWETVSVEDIAVDIYRGSGIKKDEVTESGISCVRYGEIYTKYNYSFNSCYSHTIEANIKSPKYFENGDLLFTITGESIDDIAKCIAYIGNERCLAGGDIVVLKHQQEPRFLSYALMTPDVIKQKGLGKTKLKVVHSNVPSIKSLKFHLAPLEKQKKIADKLDRIRILIKEYENFYYQELSEYEALKQSILRKAFNGEL